MATTVIISWFRSARLGVSFTKEWTDTHQDWSDLHDLLLDHVKRFNKTHTDAADQLACNKLDDGNQIAISGHFAYQIIETLLSMPLFDPIAPKYRFRHSTLTTTRLLGKKALQVIVAQLQCYALEQRIHVNQSRLNWTLQNSYINDPAYGFIVDAVARKEAQEVNATLTDIVSTFENSYNAQTRQIFWVYHHKIKLLSRLHLSVIDEDTAPSVCERLKIGIDELIIKMQDFSLSYTKLPIKDKLLSRQDAIFADLTQCASQTINNLLSQLDNRVYKPLDSGFKALKPIFCDTPDQTLFLACNKISLEGLEKQLSSIKKKLETLPKIIRSPNLEPSELSRYTKLNDQYHATLALLEKLKVCGQGYRRLHTTDQCRKRPIWYFHECIASYAESVTRAIGNYAQEVVASCPSYFPKTNRSYWSNNGAHTCFFMPESKPAVSAIAFNHVDLLH